MEIFVNGKKVDENEIQAEFQRLKPHYEQTFTDQTQDQQKAQLLEWSTENVIERKLIQQHAEKYPLKIDKKKIDNAFEQASKQQQDLKETDKQEIKKQIELQLKTEHMLDDLCKDITGPDVAEVEKYYQENNDRFTSPERIKVSHIVKHINWQSDEKTAQQLMQKAHAEMKTGTPFEMLVSKYSDCPDRGGDLGYIAKGQMVEEFEDVVFNLNPGQTSGVFRTRFGFHIAKLYDRKQSKLEPLEKVNDQIVTELNNLKREKIVEAFIDELRNNAEIKKA
ncbi:MAG: peptidylprolyl isomerase [Planctomycetota bacterium]|jgi:parvulin-like peptidyl-prolyl isomerase